MCFWMFYTKEVFHWFLSIGSLQFFAMWLFYRRLKKVWMSIMQSYHSWCNIVDVLYVWYIVVICGCCIGYHDCLVCMRSRYSLEEGYPTIWLLFDILGTLYACYIGHHPARCPLPPFWPMLSYLSRVQYGCPIGILKVFVIHVADLIVGSVIVCDYWLYAMFKYTEFSCMGLFLL